MINEIKKQLLNNPIHIQNILEYYGFCHIDIRSQEIRCGIAEDTNKTSVRIKLHNNDYLYVSDYGRGINYDIINFLIQSKHIEFKEVINVIKKELGITNFSYEKKNGIFGGFYDKIKIHKNTGLELKEYDEQILNDYKNKYNLRFLKDNISFASQKKFQIGFDVISQRITCPWWSFDGKLVGITGRYNGDYEIDNISKWMPVIPHPKSQTLYGYTENYQYLQGCNELFVGESEKFVLQLDTMEIYSSVALGGNTLHAPQIKHLIWLNPQKIIFCFDEGLDEEIILAQIKKMKSMLKFHEIQIGYVIDRENIILAKGNKESPSDLGKEKFLELKNNFVEWV